VLIHEGIDHMLQLGKRSYRGLMGTSLVDGLIGIFETFRAPRHHLIRRSTSGRLSIYFDAGCCYPAMVDDLQAAFMRFGCLVGVGEELSGSEWLARIGAHGSEALPAEVNAIRTLMRSE
jgi:hypothetical protein